MGGRLLDYIAQGLAADLPLAADMATRITVGGGALYFAHDTQELSIFDSDAVAWVTRDLTALTGSYSALADVDWSTPPTDGQVMAWNTAAGKFIPTTP